MRLPKLLRRRAAEDRRVDAFLAAIRVSALYVPQLAVEARTLSLPRVTAVETPRGRVWRLDPSSRARLERSTAELPKIVARASAPLR